MRLLLPFLFSLLLIASAPPADAGTIRDATLRSPTRDPRGALAEELVRSATDGVLRSAPEALTTDAPDTDSGRIDLRAVPQTTAAPISAPARVTIPGGTLTISHLQAAGSVIEPGIVPEPHTAGLLALAALALTGLRRRR